MADPFTIRIYVPEGDPEGVRIIDRLSSTGIFFAFPRIKWEQIKNREKLIPFGDSKRGTLQGPQYTSYEKLKTAKKVSDLFIS